ncbi:MAG: hypothetical protein GY679_01970 [Mycoplasma sp.]|nr:hypothetical protein [Mycoplasma sp.]
MSFEQFGKTKLLKNITKDIRHAAQFQGKDESNNPIMDRSVIPPTVTFTGTIKLHGTNAGVGYNVKTKEIWAQSRRDVITIQKDNYGFAFYVEANKDHYKELFNKIVNENNDVESIIIYGEWSGKGVQKGVAISQLDKAFYVFGIKFIYENRTEWVEDINKYIINNDIRGLYSIARFKTYTIDIDFSNPKEAANKMTEWVNEVEKECPVAKTKGISGTGEGIVFIGHYKGQRYKFKAKGKEHSVIKSKEVVPIDIEKIETVNKFVEYAVTENRLKQGIKEIFNEETISVQRLGDFLKWIVNDIVSEEIDVLVNNNLEARNVNRSISNKAKEWFFIQLKELK